MNIKSFPNWKKTVLVCAAFAGIGHATIVGSTPPCTPAPFTMKYEANSGPEKTPVIDSLREKAVQELRLDQFEARLENGLVVLVWRPAEKENTRGYDIQRSTDGAHWKSIHFMNGHLKPGMKGTFTLEDDPGIAGTYRYRLRQVRWEGEFAVSSERHIIFEKKEPETFATTFGLQSPQINEGNIEVIFTREIPVVGFYTLFGETEQELGRGIFAPGSLAYQIPMPTPVPGRFKLSISVGELAEDFEMNNDE